MADQNVPRYQHINVSDFVNFFLKSGLFIMEGERCALCNWWSDVMVVLICYLFAVIHNSIWLLSYYILSIKVNCAPCLVSLQEKLFIPLPSKSLFCFLWTILVAYVTSLGCFGCLMDIKEHFGCQQTQIFSMYGFSALTKAFQDPSTLFARCSWT